MKKIIKKSLYIGVLVSFFLGIISCEKDFTDIGTNIVSNTKFSTGEILLDISVENSFVEKVSSDNILKNNVPFEPGQYLLGVHNSTDYEKIEASIISQIAINTSLKLVDKTYGADTTVVSTIDTVFLKLPYQATLISNTSTGPEYTLDSIIGNQAKSFSLNMYQIDTYLSALNPIDPSKSNNYFSNDPFQKIGSELNSDVNFKFKPKYDTIFKGLPNQETVVVDTMMIVKRRLNNNNIYKTDTIKYSPSAANTTVVPIPFARIPLDEAKFRSLFLDKYESAEFASQSAFNDYFRGIVLEATGNEGSLISFNFNNTNIQLNPSIEVYYTNTVLKSGTTIIDTIQKNNSFPLSGIRRNQFKMVDRTYPVNQEVKIQGAAGSEAKVKILGGNQLTELRAKNWLINDASITFYINQKADTTAVPYRLYLYKEGETNTTPPQLILSQIKDSYSESLTFGGFMARENKKANSYTFKVTDYISDLLSGETNYNPPLKLKVFNSTDLPVAVTDTIFSQYHWNPKAVTIFNHSATDATKKAQLKISYSERK